MARASLITLGLLALVASGSAKAGQPTGDLIVVPKTEEFILGGTRHYDHVAIGRGLGNRVKESLAGGRVLVVRPPVGVNWRQYRQTLLATGSYASVEPNTVAELTATPNDPLFNNQWHLFQISAPRAWDFETGTNSPILAVVDGGVNLTHPDLAPNLVPGYNTISGLAQAQGGAVNDVTTSGHGTRTAGVAAARGNNGIGVSGVGWDLRVMPVRATDSATGATPRSELLEGVQWAVQNGAKVVSVSYTEVEFNDVEAMGAWARSQGALLVWSAGNSKTNWANFDHDNVTVVGGTSVTSTGQDIIWDQGATGSGYGKGVDCFAPCTQIYTINKAGGYGNAPAGVSFAVPQVAATLALMMGREPTLSPAEIERRMLLRCGNMGPLGNDINFGFGRLNGGAAVEWPIRRYQLELLPTSAIPGASNVWPYKVIDDGTVFGTVYRTGQSAVIAKWHDGALVSWQSSEQALGIAFSDIVITDVNENGVLTGWAYNGEYYGFILGLGGLIDTLHNPSLGRSYINGISNSGHAVGLHLLGWGNTRARYRDVNGAWSAPLESPPYSIGGSAGFYKIAEDHRVVGSIGSQPIFFRGDLGIEYCEPNGFLNVEVMESTEEGAFVGWFAPDAPSADSWYIRAILYSAKGAIMRNFGVFTYAPGLNESLEVVGADLINTSAAVAARIFDGYNPGLLIDKLVPQPNTTNQTLPTTVTTLNECPDINNVGQLIVRGRSTLNQWVGLTANPVDTPGLALSLGQLGSSPTYVGSIPPSLSVTFTNAAGTPYPDANVQLTYASSVGRLGLDPPPSVTGNYRIYMRCNSAAIPGYEGTPFLNRLYPPLNEPAVPRDAFYLPYTSPTSYNNQPVLEMYPGDVDSSGEVDAADIDGVIATFGMVNGDPGFGPTDVDGTGEIDAADIDVVIENFGLVGDPEP